MFCATAIPVVGIQWPKMIPILCTIHLSLIAFIAWTIWRSEHFIPSICEAELLALEWPSVSIVACARNEETSIAQAVTTLLNQDYPDYELIVVNDRSTDRTGAILKELQLNYPSLVVATVETLPAGWLGKCNAMKVGATTAKGQWLLFTDADVFMQPDTLKRAISFAHREQADHLALAPACTLPSWMLTVLVSTFVVFFKLFVKPAQISNPSSLAHVGIGAFNLLRSHVYRDIGGHEPIRLRPDDDVKLGKLVKQHGYRQRFASGIGQISVPWYSTLGQMMRGLEKNCFAGVDYKLGKIAGANIVSFLTFVAPFLLVWFVGGISFWLMLTACSLVLGIGVHSARSAGYRVDHGLFFPLGVLLFLYTFDRAVFLTLLRGGINWRDTFYSLDELKRNVV